MDTSFRSQEKPQKLVQVIIYLYKIFKSEIHNFSFFSNFPSIVFPLWLFSFYYIVLEWPQDIGDRAKGKFGLSLLCDSQTLPCMIDCVRFHYRLTSINTPTDYSANLTSIKTQMHKDKDIFTTWLCPTVHSSESIFISLEKENEIVKDKARRCSVKNYFNLQTCCK